MATSLLHSYLRDLHTTRATGAAVKETSYYGVLANLLNGVGASLKPKVRCILHPQNRGAGIPDGGLFAQEQWQKAEERAALGEQVAVLGATACDIYLNNVAYWRCIPVRVWKYTLGGYQVMKKWLSYREQPLLGRPLKVEEVREVMGMARRIAAILLLETALDANYAAIQAATVSWPQKSTKDTKRT